MSAKTPANDTHRIRLDLNGVIVSIYNLIDSSYKHAATLILSLCFVVCFLLVIPALVQSAAAYAWSIQRYRCFGRIGVKGRTNESCRSMVEGGQGRTEANKATEERGYSHLHRTLFLYRLLACSSSLCVLLFSTLPQLVFAIAAKGGHPALNEKWGWCHIITYADLASRTFATFLIVLGFVLLFWNYLFTEIRPSPSRVMPNVFSTILRASLVIGVVSIGSPIYFVVNQFNKNAAGLCGSNNNNNTFFYEYFIIKLGPALVIFTTGCFFLHWLPYKEFGVLQEPAIFLCLMLPTMLCETIIFILYLADQADLIINQSYSHFLILSYAIYHMSFSCTFILATLRALLDEIHEERLKREASQLDDNGESSRRYLQSQASKRRQNMIYRLQRQFSVAFRWKPNFSEDEVDTVTGPPESLLDTTNRIRKDQSSPTTSKQGDKVSEATAANEDDVTMHYAILQKSVGLKVNKRQKDGVSPSHSIGRSAGDGYREAHEVNGYWVPHHHAIDNDINEQV